LKADPECGISEQVHTMDYLVYAYLQLGQDQKAGDVIDEMKSVAGFNENFIPRPYALAASPARYAIERADWKAASELQVRASPMTQFARALGAPLGQSGGRERGYREAQRAT
jgi:hypothetical protein